MHLAQCVRISFVGDIVGVPFLSQPKHNLKTTNLIGKPYYSGSEATFNLAVNLITLNMMKSLGTVSNSKLVGITSNLNLGE